MDLRRIGRICRYSFSFGDWASTRAKLEEKIFNAATTEALQQIARNREFPRYRTGHWDVVKTRTRIGIVQFCLRTNCRLMVDAFHSGFDNSFITNHNDVDTEITLQHIGAPVRKHVEQEIKAHASTLAQCQIVYERAGSLQSMKVRVYLYVWVWAALTVRTDTEDGASRIFRDLEKGDVQGKGHFIQPWGE